MTQVSKRYIPPWTLEKILTIFLNSFLKIKDKKTAKQFFEEFLTPTEKIMLAKRITAFYLLYKKVSIRESSDILKLSTSTLVKYSYFMKRNVSTNTILENLLRDENFRRLVDTILYEYLHPPGSYGTMWSQAGEEKLAYQRRKQSPL